MTRFVLRRLCGLIATLLLASFVIFAAVYLAPGDPLAFLTKGRTIQPDALAQLKAQYHLDQPFLVRYWFWLRDAVRGDFGRSVVTRDDVGGMISTRVETTALLVAYAGVPIVAGGVLLGMIAGIRRGIVGGFARLLSSIGLATPAFVASIILVTLFAVDTRWFPVFGPGDGFFDRLYHLTLPAFALAISLVAYIARITQASIGEEIGREHVETARSRGIPTRLINRRHVLRNALIPITTASSLTVASLLSAMVVVEYAFTLNGLGSLLLKSVEQGDFAVVQATALIFVAAFVVVNTLVDLLYALIDPRITATRAATE